MSGKWAPCWILSTTILQVLNYTLLKSLFRLTMEGTNVKSSFTLRPSHTGAFSSYVTTAEGIQPIRNKKSSRGTSSSTQIPLSTKDESSSSPSSQRALTMTSLTTVSSSTPSPVIIRELLVNRNDTKAKSHRHPTDERVVAPTLITGTPWKQGYPSTARIIRASPFEPLVLNRNLPRDGTISPLRMDEYFDVYKSKQTDFVGSNKRQRFCVENDDNSSLSTDEDDEYYLDGDDDAQDHQDDCCRRRRDTSGSAPPPLAEVTVPLAAVVRQGLIELSKEEWRRLYLSTYNDLEETQLQLSSTAEENRLLKRQLIEMQKQLFEVRRNKRCSPSHEFPSWTVPDYTHNAHCVGTSDRSTPVTTNLSSQSKSAAAPTKTVSYDEQLSKTQTTRL